MAASIGKMQILKLYKTMLRESEKFASYNFKNYTIRRIKDAFKANKTLTDPKRIQQELAYAQENLRMIRRQSVIGDMFRSEKLVIENRGQLKRATRNGSKEATEEAGEGSHSSGVHS